MTLKLCFIQVKFSWKRTGIKHLTCMREWRLLIKMQGKKIRLIYQFQDISWKFFSLPQCLQLVGCITVVHKWLRAQSCYVPWVHPQKRSWVWETHIVWDFYHSFKYKLRLSRSLFVQAYLTFSLWSTNCRLATSDLLLSCWDQGRRGAGNSQVCKMKNRCFSRDFFRVWEGNVPFLYETFT